jgi:hypothetical protein
MRKNFQGIERRKFLRADFSKSLRYTPISAAKDKSAGPRLTDAVSKNLSASGILFITNTAKAPDISTLLVMDLDFKTAAICREIEDRVFLMGNKLVGKVVRIEDNEDGTCGVGVAFVTKSDPISADLKKLESIVNNSKK